MDVVLNACQALKFLLGTQRLVKWMLYMLCKCVSKCSCVCPSDVPAMKLRTLSTYIQFQYKDATRALSSLPSPPDLTFSYFPPCLPGSSVTVTPSHGVLCSSQILQRTPALPAARLLVSLVGMGTLHGAMRRRNPVTTSNLRERQRLSRVWSGASR